MMNVEKVAPVIANPVAHEDGGTDAVEGVRTREELLRWVHDRLSLPPELEEALLRAVEQVLVHYEHAWRDSKDEALHAIAAGVTYRLNRMRDEMNARDATSSTIARYFERVVTDLTERAHRDDKTQLLNFRRFMEHVELCLTVERQAPWCALGVADITSFKAHNDTFGHAVGDRIIETVASLLRSEVRSSDRIAYQQDVQSTSPLHARFGGDEFCFFLSDLEDAAIAATVAERFRQAVVRHDWSSQHPGLSQTAVNVDVGVVSLRLGPVGKRHLHSRLIAEELFARADTRLYMVKRGEARYVSHECVRVEDGRLVEVDASETYGWGPCSS